MAAKFRAQPKPEHDDDIEYFKNHPLGCKELTPEALARPEI